jgi:hypothetical protein
LRRSCHASVAFGPKNGHLVVGAVPVHDVGSLVHRIKHHAAKTQSDVVELLRAKIGGFCAMSRDDRDEGLADPFRDTPATLNDVSRRHPDAWPRAILRGLASAAR